MLLKRERYLKQIRPFYEVDLIKVLLGSRRCGKSKMLELIMNEFRQKGIDQEHIIYVNFENAEFDFIKTYRDLNNYILSKVESGRYYIFLDEIQQVSEFEKAVNSFRVTLDCSLFITGSNSKILSGELATLLTGRVVEINIYPFSYSEVIEYLEINHRNIPDNFILDYVKHGGYPLRLNLDDSFAVQTYLTQLYDAILEKDIFKRNTEFEKTKFKRVAAYVIENAGRDFKAQSIVDYLNKQYDTKITVQSVYRYLERMEKAFLITPVHDYLINGKQILNSVSKYYVVDCGFRFVNSNAEVRDIGLNLENIVFNELKTRGYDVYVGKTYKGEVDFVAVKNTKKVFIQVAYLMTDESTLRREFDAFKPIKDASFKCVLSMDRIDFSQDGIVHINIEDFLSGKNDIF